MASQYSFNVLVPTLYSLLTLEIFASKSFHFLLLAGGVAPRCAAAAEISVRRLILGPTVRGAGHESPCKIS